MATTSEAFAMASIRDRSLLELLCDGEFHTGDQLGRALGLSRSAVWKKVEKLAAFGIDVDRVRGVGYRISGGMELLDPDRLRASCAQWAGDVTVLDLVDSTNSVAMLWAMRGGARNSVFFAEAQTAGRGRRGKEWQSPFGTNIYMSYVWGFSRGVSEIQGLSLVVGIAICRALESCGVAAVAIKWPNDIVVQGKKCGGILIEIGGDAGGAGVAVIGVGVNTRMPVGSGSRIDQPWTDLDQNVKGALSRNEMAERLVCAVKNALDEFEKGGFVGFEGEWRRLDCLSGREVMLTSGAKVVTGVARGVTRSGALLVEDGDGLKEHSAGEVSVRRSR